MDKKFVSFIIRKLSWWVWMERNRDCLNNLELVFYNANLHCRFMLLTWDAIFIYLFIVLFCFFLFVLFCFIVLFLFIFFLFSGSHSLVQQTLWLNLQRKLCCCTMQFLVLTWKEIYKKSIRRINMIFALMYILYLCLY